MKIGLALGGGSARGLAHIPMLEAFDELGVKPAMIVGCSMGALIGAGYAGGMSGRELREHAIQLLSNRTSLARHVFGAKKTKLGDIFNLSGLLSLHLNGQKLADIVIPDHLPTNIEDQPIPVKIVATNYELMEEVVFERGPVLEAVGASIAIPGLVAGPRIGGHLHVDGGVKNPVPFNHALGDLIVAIDVTGRPRPVLKANPTNLELAVGGLLIMFHELANLRRAQAAPHIYSEPDINHFGAGDYFKVKEIFAAAEPAKEQLKRALDLRINAKA